MGNYTAGKAVFTGDLNFLAFDWDVALDGAFVISRPLKDAGTWRTDRLRAASLVPLRLDLSGSVSALTNVPSRATSRQNLKNPFDPVISNKLFYISPPHEKQLQENTGL